MSKKELKNLIKSLQNDEKVRKQVEKRIKEFQKKNKEDNKSWFDELSFCLLTANSSARKGIEIQNYLSRIDGFRNLPQKKLTQVLKRMGHRFFNKRAEFIVEARKHQQIKDIISNFSDENEARGWLVKNIKGLGHKEASHFLRNVGYHNVVILDRHVLRVLNDHNLIDEVPKSLTPKKYKEIEKLVLDLAKEVEVLPSELDLYLWYSKTGKVLK
ncbi:MAG: N-glycosylase/DNA lyase [Candidatus Heimdallarchaeaceae archaeon]